MSCSSAFFGLFSVNSAECGANKVELSNEVYNQLNNFISNSLNSGINVSSANVNKINIEQTNPQSVIKCSVLQENIGNIKVVNNITQSQKAELKNNLVNEVSSEVTQEQEQAILKAFEGEGKSNITEIENDLKSIISNTIEQSLNSFINTGSFNGNELNLKIAGNLDCEGKPLTQRNISDIQIDNFITTFQDALAQSEVVNTISNAITQKNVGGLSSILRYLIIGGVVLGVLTIIGGIIFGYFKLRSGACEKDADCRGPNQYCGNKKMNPKTKKEEGICMPKSPTAPKPSLTTTPK